MRKRLRTLAGAIFWTAMAVWGGRLLTEGPRDDAGTLGKLLGFLAERESQFLIELPTAMLLRVGDTVEASGKTVGDVEALLDEDGRATPEIYGWTQMVRIRIHDRDRTTLRSGARARLLRVPEAAAWVVKTLLTEETIPRIAFEWNQAMLQHREVIFTLLTPIIRDLILDLEAHIEAELPAFLRRHEAEVKSLGEELRRGQPAERLTQLFEEEVWPIAQSKLDPIIAKISDEFWERLPLWSLTWRLAYQALPGTDNDHLQKGWLNFLNREAMPILRSHTDEIIALSRDIAAEALSRQEVHGALRDLFALLIAQPKFHVLTQDFLREVMLDNPGFQARLLERARSPDVGRALEAAAQHIEPMARRMSDVLFGTREAGITVEFAKVLRSQILLKDSQRFVLNLGQDGSPPLPDGTLIRATVEVEHAR